MSTALAIGAVSAVLRNVLDNGLIDAVPAVGSPVEVTAQAPDLIKLDAAMPHPQLNLFAYRVSLNPGWRNAGQPTRDRAGRHLSSPPLGLDVHYLLTAYGRHDFHAEILLGYGMHLLHERPFLDRGAIRQALQLVPVDAAMLPDAFRTPPNAGLADQLETLKITWEPLDLEEMSKLWAAVQSHYRPSVAYQVSVVLIQAPPAPRPDPLPVRTRTVVAHADPRPPYPSVQSVEARDGTATAELGEPVTVRGRHLAGSAITIHLRHQHLQTANDIPGPAINTDETDLTFTLPVEPDAHPWPAGVWAVSVTLTPRGETTPRTTNVGGLLIAATPDPTGAALARDATGRVTVTVAVTPAVRAGQQVAVALDSFLVPVDSPATDAHQVTATFAQPPAGDAWLRVLVDGVDSKLVVEHTAPTPPETRRVRVP